VIIETNRAGVLDKLELRFIIGGNMAWSRTVLTLVFLLATLLGNTAFVSALAETSGRIDMVMSADASIGGSVSKDCGACEKTNGAMTQCLAAACSAGAALPPLSRQDLGSPGLLFGRPADQHVQRPIYSPDPHPPKFSPLT
jgi:hypothetical protein